jgi:plastocyanin
MRKLTLIAAIAVLAFAGCGGDDSEEPASGSGSSSGSSSSSSGGGGENLTIAADPSGALKFDKKDLSAKAGKVTITMDNPSDVPHAVSIEGNGVDEDGQTVGKGAKSEVSADLKAGKYTFYCPVGNHRQAGMEGTLTVQ